MSNRVNSVNIFFTIKHSVGLNTLLDLHVNEIADMYYFIVLDAKPWLDKYDINLTASSILGSIESFL